MTKVISVDMGIMMTLYYLITANKRTYCFPSQEKLLEILKEKYDIMISRRTLNYHLRKLGDLDFIFRKRRIKKDDNGVLKFKSTLYWLKKGAWKLLTRMGCLLQQTVKMLKKNKGFFSDENETEKTRSFELREDQERRARGIMREINKRGFSIG